MCHLVDLSSLSLSFSLDRTLCRTVAYELIIVLNLIELFIINLLIFTLSLSLFLTDSLLCVQYALVVVSMNYAISIM